MKRAQTKESFARRIERATAYIADNLDGDLSLETIAGKAFVSPYHFHRVYRGAMGETVGDSVRRMRMHRAAGELIGSSRPILRVARRAGYGSAEAFTRAFAADYGMPPAAYRAANARVPPNGPQPDQETDMYEVKLKTQPPLRLAAFEHRGDYDEIGKVFEKLLAWAIPRGIVGPQARNFGIYYDDPESVPMKDLRSHACLLVGPDFKGEGEARLIELPGGPVASLLHKGPYVELRRPYNFLYREWLPSSGKEPADRPCYEEYLNDPRGLPPTEWLTEIFLPLAK